MLNTAAVPSAQRVKQTRLWIVPGAERELFHCGGNSTASLSGAVALLGDGAAGVEKILATRVALLRDCPS
jgi:hypothetical protein